MVNPIGSPAFTWAASAVFRILIAGAATHVEAVELSPPAFVVVTVPVLSILPVPPGHVPPVSAVVSEVTCTVKVLAASVVPAGTVTPARPPHFRVPALMEHAPAQPAPMLSIDQDRP